MKWLKFIQWWFFINCLLLTFWGATLRLNGSPNDKVTWIMAIVCGIIFVSLTFIRAKLEEKPW